MQQILDAIVPIIIFIAVISGIINSVRENAAKTARTQDQPVQPSRVQSEIAAFLAGVDQKSKPAPDRPTMDRSASSSRRQKPAQSQAAQSQQARQKQNKQTSGQKSQDAVQPQKTTAKSRPVGSGLAQHVDSFIGDHVRQHMGHDVDNFVQKDIGERVKSHLGSQSSQPVEMTASDTGSREADDMLGVLRSRVGVRHAILVNEILSKPLSLRKK